MPQALSFGPPIPGAPWSALPRPLGPPLPPKLERSDKVGPVRMGPPVPGAPWTQSNRLTYGPPPFVAPTQPQFPPPKFVTGPPVPGAPWARQLWKPPTWVVPAPGSRPTPGPASPGTAKPFIRRVRDADDDQRLRGAVDTIAVLLNSLLAQGHVQLTGQQTYAVRGGAFTGTRAPGATDDATQGVSVGSWWVNTSTGDTYICTNNSANGAVWVKK